MSNEAFIHLRDLLTDLVTAKVCMEENQQAVLHLFKQSTSHEIVNRQLKYLPVSAHQCFFQNVETWLPDW